MATDKTEDNLSLSRVAYQRLRGEILAGTFAPDMPLRLEFLRERYGISFSPLREALSQLQVERLVSATSNRGFRVAPVSLEEMWDAINARILIEAEALRLSVEYGDDLWEGNIVSSFHALDKSRQRLLDAEDGSLTDLELIESRHQHFHQMLLAACPSALLLQMSATLYAQTERYRRPLLSRASPETVGSKGPHDDHRAMMSAALARDVVAAVDLLRRHLTATGRFIQANSEAREKEMVAA
ncbi:GntR family transcriptional regulator [Sphingomonas hengshuiensis]|uniref:GntR family transcriptional regulator n=1 Tax=Sphingomonas hengshuiensis TaxID=1609977 RepID=UPI0005C83226|nr:GntR family transcriptional regulator [Sphingomonas hengshuiensis]